MSCHLPLRAQLLLASDLVAQHAFTAALPVGSATVVLGGVFFLGQLWHEGPRN